MKKPVEVEETCTRRLAQETCTSVMLSCARRLSCTSSFHGTGLFRTSLYLWVWVWV